MQQYQEDPSHIQVDSMHLCYERVSINKPGEGQIQTDNPEDEEKQLYSMHIHAIMHIIKNIISLNAKCLWLFSDK